MSGAAPRLRILIPVASMDGLKLGKGGVICLQGSRHIVLTTLGHAVTTEEPCDVYLALLSSTDFEVDTSELAGRLPAAREDSNALARRCQGL